MVQATEEPPDLLQRELRLPLHATDGLGTRRNDVRLPAAAVHVAHREAVLAGGLLHDALRLLSCELLCHAAVFSRAQFARFASSRRMKRSRLGSQGRQM